MKVKDVYNALCVIAPLSTQEPWDNSGFQFGYLEDEVRKALLALDVTKAVIEEAATLGANLIVTHHPLIFPHINSISDLSVTGELVLKLAEHHISVISMHTCLDLAHGGVNDILLKTLQAVPDDVPSNPYMRIGCYSTTYTEADFLTLVKEQLQVNALRYVSGPAAIQKIAVIGGAGAEFWKEAFAAGCDAMVTADVKYHQFLEARDAGFLLIDADHYCTEAPVMAYMEQKMRALFPQEADKIILSKKHCQTVKLW